MVTSLFTVKKRLKEYKCLDLDENRFDDLRHRFQFARSFQRFCDFFVGGAAFQFNLVLEGFEVVDVDPSSFDACYRFGTSY